MNTPSDKRRKAQRHGSGVTMKDVAMLAGVSHQTVSRVLNGNGSVSQKAVERVSWAIAKTGYRPNPAARALVTRKSMILGVISFGQIQYGPAQTIFGITSAARERGYATSLMHLAEFDVASVRSAIEEFQAESVDGIVVIAPVRGAMEALAACTLEVPVVRFEPGLDNGTTCISVDEISGARLATRHLLELGHQTVWHVSGPKGWLGTEARIQGWHMELAAHKRVAYETIVGDWSSASGYRAGQAIAENPAITAVFIANDQMALGVLHALQERGVRVPEDISLVGFDDIPEARFFTPSLTTISVDFGAVGLRCVERLMEMIHGLDVNAEPQARPELIVRSSTTEWSQSSRYGRDDSLITAT